MRTVPSMQDAAGSCQHESPYFFNYNESVNMRIFTDANGLAVNAISELQDGTNVRGHEYVALCGAKSVALSFQNGAVPANGVNGLTNEALLAVLIHRTCFLDDKFPCEENKAAITHMQAALNEFNKRTEARVQRGVEGKEVV